MAPFDSLFDPAWVKDQAMGSPFEFWTWTLAVLLAGAAVGFAFGKVFNRAAAARAAEQLDDMRRMLDNANGRISGLEADVSRKDEKLAYLANRLDERGRLEQRRRDEAAARSWVMGLMPWDKVLLLRVSRVERFVTAKPMDDQEMRECLAHVRQGVACTRVKAHEYNRYTYRLVLTDFGKLATKVAMDLLEEAEEYEKDADG